MKLGFFGTGVTQQLDFAEFARWGSEHGFRAMDVPPDRPGTRAICDRLELQVNCTTGLYGNPITRDDREREEQLARLRQAIDLAATQGIPNVSAGHRRDPSLTAPENIHLFQLAYQPLAAYAEQKGVRLVFENWPNGGLNLMITPELWDHAFNAVPSAALGLVFDPSHLVWQGIDYLRAARDFGSRIYHAHAKDTELLSEGQYRYGIYGPQTETPVGSAGWWRYRLPGFGVVDWPKFIDVLYQVGFDSVISIEHEDHVWGFTRDAERAKRGLLLTQQLLTPLLV
jgi:sugar phosphate isomerase/epimerase